MRTFRFTLPVACYNRQYYIYTQIYQCIYASLQAGPLEQAAEAGSSQCKHKHRDSQFQCIKQYYPCIYFIIQVGSILIIGTPIYPTYIKPYMCVYISPSYCQSIYLSPMLMKKQKQLNSIQVGENTLCIMQCQLLRCYHLNIKHFEGGIEVRNVQ